MKTVRTQVIPNNPTVPDKEHPLFCSHFNFNPHSIVNFVGGGGKTALIYRLMDEFAKEGTVLYTTTTRIHPPDPDKEVTVISSQDLTLLKLLVDNIIRARLEKHHKLVVTRQFMEPDLLKGVPPGFPGSIDRDRLAISLNEADGAARFSIKLPREGEPVLADQADYLVAVIGIDCLHKPLGPDVVFRFQTLADRFSLQAGDPVSPRIAADILMHPLGVCRDYTEGTTIIPFINKVETPEMESDARTLAGHILQNGHYPVKRVVWGSVLQGRVDSLAGES